MRREALLGNERSKTKIVALVDSGRRMRREALLGNESGEAGYIVGNNLGRMRREALLGNERTSVSGADLAVFYVA